MLHVVYGVYRWKPTRLAFRNDYCLKCEAPRRSVLVRTFNAGHIYWIPLFPVGFWKRWVCTTCGHNPHASVKTRRGFKWLGLVILLLFSALFWAMPIDPEHTTVGWAVRMAAPLGTIFTLRHLLQTKKEPSLAERLTTVQPAADTVCPFCGAQLLLLTSKCSCPLCGAVRL